MKKWKLGTPSPGTVLGSLALFVALGGTAAALQGQNTVRSDDIVNGQVKSADIGTNQVRSPDVVNGNLRGLDIRNGAVGPSKLRALEAPHLVGTEGEPAFGNGGEGDCIWAAPTNQIIPITQPSFYKDLSGVVHLQGRIDAANGPGGDGTCDALAANDGPDGFLFALPEGYRPTGVVTFSVGGRLSQSNDPGDVAPEVQIIPTEINLLPGQPLPAGALFIGRPPDQDAAISLDGIEFRTD